MKSEEVQQRTAEALEQLSQALAQGKSEAFLAYLSTMAKFHRYSFGNCLLIACQRPDATRVAGFQRWKQLGRHVKKGERGILILAPLVGRKPAADEEPDGAETAPRQLRGFRVAYIFDVAQTEGQPLPELVGIGGDPGTRLRDLENLVQKLGIALRYEPLPAGAHGVSKRSEILIAPELPAAETFSALAHELAHELLHDVQRRREDSKKALETEAEAVAFVVCQAVGLESLTCSSDYIQSWSGDPEQLAQSLERIQQTAARILRGLDEDHADARPLTKEETYA